ncbi:MAG: hypothetical protein KF767_03810 [Bdellovibrionaceae bacterium]|nr:hypothetical protein [Pseudobdellovibrionaceae bacterium]
MPRTFAPYRTLLAVLTCLLGLLLAFPDLASAQALSTLGRGNAYFGRGAGVFSLEKLRAAGVTEVKTLAGQKEMTLVFMGANGKALRQFVWQRTAPKTLEEFRPSKVRQWLKTMKSNSGSILTSKVRHFPFEAAAFFTAIGAINMYDLIFHYQHNPVIMKQFGESQMDPVTHVSFMAFMAANGMTSEPLQEVMRNPRLHYFLPYFGMSMGMMASNIVHDVWASKMLRACAKSMFSNNPDVDMACDQAWDDMNKHWNDKWGQYATGWLSMMGSTAIGGAVDWLAGTAARRALQFAGLELAFSFGTGGMSMAARFAWTVVKNVQFLALDFWLRQPIETVWLNVFGKASELNSTAMCLGTLHQMHRLQTHAGTHPRKAAFDLMKSKFCGEELIPALQTYSRLSQEWRMENMKQTLAAHQNWQMYLANFAGHYRSTRLFYQHLTDQIWKKNYGSNGQPSPLDQTNNFFGVLPDGATEVDWTLYLQDIRPLEEAQRKRIQKVAAKWLLFKNTEIFNQLVIMEQRRYERFIGRLASSEVSEIRKALEELNLSMPDQDPSAVRPPIGYLTDYGPSSEEYRAIMETIVKDLGRPRPVSSPGEGFLKAWAQWQGRDREAETSGAIQPFARQHGPITTLSAPEYMAAAMTAGPDIEKDGQLINRSRWGGMAQFNPPSILFDGEITYSNNLPLRSDNRGYETIFSKLGRHSKFECQKQSRHECMAPTWKWLSSGWVRPSVMDKSGNHMAKWWAEKVEPPYLDAWYEFETEYETVVKQYAQQLLDIGQHWSNGTGFANAGVASLEQERATYLTFVNDYMIARTGKELTIIDAPYRMHNRAAEEVKDLRPELDKYMKSWDEVISYLPRMKTDLNEQMDAAKGVLLSRVPNEKLEEGVKKMDEALDEVLKGLGIAEDTQNPQEQVALVTLRALKNTHQEILDYGLVLNTASYSENHALNGKPQKQRCLNLPSSGGAANFRGQNTKGCP